MNAQDPRDTGVWRPPAAEPSWFTPAPRLPRPDVRVWPPPAPEEDQRSTSTVPMPAVTNGSVPPRLPWPPPGTPPRPAAAPAPAAAPPPFGAGRAEPPAAPATRSAPERRGMPTAARITLQLFGAVALSAALLAVTGYDALSRFEKDNAHDVRQVAQGQEATLLNTRWRLLGVKVMSPQPENMAPGTVSMQVDLEGTALNEKGVYYSIAPPGFRLGDGTGRTWMALAFKQPDQLSPGTPGRFSLVSSVPKAVAGEVELVLWPNENAAAREIGQALRFDR
ncbi:hypothetical protein Sme01_57590 [Sphaerisporangium melleum]|uniref:Uncharacterized protein n=1 Tax=Sphaerisporangium melleum TaxID=321316 RepID=A0A917VM38_9ACTN|nr:hypothetical protein [Sphaerisporangium melleum]GGK94863.1 hypothetical protein GCM10007964_41470 [Sphaerisporangium melleum]GII73283.1 hypothetical protein Sme01_57590 [Sphaerisporangium melleum]